ncbi:hypothetical protein DXN04_34405 [Chitinophaga silvisoli]|uniref:Uncharacterized protein n=1 Tax=Chitinophaga silvisoli TaxID=2291814 RepID=A0A3E1NKB9_9BACT|nr:hypothetical protein DXN04_34405 [Chitinophaga silvisoli]
MGRQPLYTRKKNIGTIVIKWDATGAEIKAYTSINLARHEEKHSYRRLMRAINQKSPLNNFFYSLVLRQFWWKLPHLIFRWKA